MKPKAAIEIADVNDPRSIAQAAQTMLLECMESVIADMKIELGGPGLTWDQVAFFLAEMKKKRIKIISQERAM